VCCIIYQNLIYGPPHYSYKHSASNIDSPFLPHIFHYQPPRGYCTTKHHGAPEPPFLGPYHTLPITNTLPSSSLTSLLFSPFFTPKITLPNYTEALPNTTAAPTTPCPAPSHSPHPPYVFPICFDPFFILPSSGWNQTP
jgi:hypothetical protein